MPIKRLPVQRLIVFLCAVLLAHGTHAAFDSASFNQSGKPLEVSRITPEGEDAPPGRQIVIQFNQPVVPLGRMERDASEVAVNITPALACEWRWLNNSALACQLGEDAALRPATRYRIDVDPAVGEEAGLMLAASVSHQFVTERPQVDRVRFVTWRSPGIPQLEVLTNQESFSDSLEQHLYLRRTGSGERLSVRATSAERSGGPSTRVWIVEPVSELPLDMAVELVIEPGLKSRAGSEVGRESRVVLEFNTFPEFRFLGVNCVRNDHQEVIISALADGSRCNPLERIALTFTAPVVEDEVKAHVRLDPDLAGGRTDYDPWSNSYPYSRLGSPHRPGQRYPVYLPELLKAYHTYSVSSDAGFRDEFGRQLPAPINMQFATDHRVPDFVVTHPLAVLEDQVDSELPVVVTNLDKLVIDYDRITADTRDERQTFTRELPAAEDIAFRTPLQLREMLNGRSGAIVGNVQSDPIVKKSDWERFLFAQVTPYQVNVKAGHFNTLVWVTDLATGQAVADAQVDVVRNTFRDLVSQQRPLAEAVTDSHGVAMLPGTSVLTPDLKLLNSYERKDPRLFVRVQKDSELALLPLDYEFEIDVWRASRYSVYPGSEREYGHIHTWGTTAQGVYRAGDTIQYKLYVRNQDNETLTPAPRDGYSLKIVDPTDKTVHEIADVRLSEFGAFDGEFTVPEAGAVGWYRFQLTGAFAERSWEPMRVLVSDFTPAPFKVKTELSGKLFLPDQVMEINTAARLHAGGPWADAGARVNATLRARSLPVRNSLARGFQFDVYRYDQPTQETLFQTEAEVNDKGELDTRFTLVDSSILYGTITVESSVQDDRGKSIAGFANASYVGRDRYVGLRSNSWTLKEDEPASVDVLVVDEQGVPAGGTGVQMVIERRETKAARVKGAGNAYVMQYTHAWVSVGNCELVSASESVACEFTPEEAGDYRLTATIADTQGRAHSSQLHSWVVGKGRVVWEERDDNSLTLIGEQESYKVGDVARYLVKNPFPGAQALITIERYGVLKSWVAEFDSSTPIVEFEIEESFLPGFYLSVIVTSPRVAKPLAQGVDLGKPAFRMGYVKADVRDPWKQIEVAVAPAAEVYKPRDTVRVNLTATPLKPGREEPIELAVAVLDEAVFDLIAGGSDYFDPYKGFYTLDGLDLRNFSLLLRLVGRQKFEKKGANAGGDGGSAPDFRSVFKYVSYWNPSITVQAGESAQIEFEAPDNLTGWRVLAMAVSPTDRMGLSEGHFAVNRDTELRPVMPNQVIEGDRFLAGFSVMNRTDQPRDIEVTLTAAGKIDVDAADTTITKTVNLAPYKRQTVWMPVEASGSGEIKFTASAGDAIDRDNLAHVVTVNRRQALETAATYGTSAANSVSEAIVFPENMRTDVGDVSVVLSPSVISNVEGAFDYMKHYPYTCWEQKLSRGTMASHYENLKAYVSDGFDWEAAATMPDGMLKQAGNFQAPNGGMTYYLPRDQYVSPYLSAYTALAFNWLSDSGYTVPQGVEQRLHGYLQQLLRDDAVPDFYSRGMASTVRAVALAALAKHGKLGKQDLQRYTSHVEHMSLFGKVHYLQAALNVADTEDVRAQVAKLILGHSNQSGGKFVLSETLDDSYTRILASPLRANCAALSALTAYGETAGGAPLVGDVPFKLVRTISQTRGGRDHWENTQENMFCMNALSDYSRVYEKESPLMSISAAVDDETLGALVFQELNDPPQTLTRDLQVEDPGRRVELKIDREGEGRFYYAARLNYSPRELRADSVNAGIEVRREHSVQRNGRWELLKYPAQLRSGELVRVDLYVSLPAARNFVVVDDPVPGGLEPVNRDLATTSAVDAEAGDFKASGGSWWYEHDDWRSYGSSRWSFYHRELRHDSARFYSDYLPAGNYHLSYTAQVIAPGEFTILPVKAEEMYDPDVFGQGVPGALNISPKIQ